MEATIIEGDHATAKVIQVAPGKVDFVLETPDGRVEGRCPFDNLVKAVARIDVEAAGESERQVKALREEVAKLRGQLLDADIQPMIVAQAQRDAAEARQRKAAAESELAHIRKTMPLATMPRQDYEDGRTEERRQIVAYLRGALAASDGRENASAVHEAMTYAVDMVRRGFHLEGSPT